QSVHRPDYTVFYRSDQPNQSACQDPLPVVGFLNYTNVSGPRWHKFQPRPHRGRGDNSAVLRISKKKLARVTPNEWKEDPYFVCVLLSLAQLQERLIKQSTPTSHLTRLIVASPIDREFIHIYEAQITSSFLGMLDNPMKATIQTKFPTIRRREIPFRPFETFQNRIWTALLDNQLPAHASDKLDGTGSKIVNEHAKRPHEQENDDTRKRGRTS
ncbi:hypothetical protein NUU61_002627, partial [Penicillium alfredii]